MLVFTASLKEVVVICAVLGLQHKLLEVGILVRVVIPWLEFLGGWVTTVQGLFNLRVGHQVSMVHT